MPGLPSWESGPGPADPAISAGLDYTYVGSGYGPVGQGTIGGGNPAPGGTSFSPAQLRFFIQGSTLYALDNVTGQAFFVSLSGLVPAPGNYSPTK